MMYDFLSSVEHKGKDIMKYCMLVTVLHILLRFMVKYYKISSFMFHSRKSQVLQVWNDMRVRK